MTETQHSLDPVLMAALPAPETGGAEAPDWIHLLPTAEGAIQTSDARGPYQVGDAARLIAASFAEGNKLPIDENHATDLAAPKGLPAPARGWIVEMQARADGIWGRVEWTGRGRELVTDRAYRAISPVVLHDKAKRIVRVLRASLVNRPNLRGLAALHEEQSMSFNQRLAEALGLEATATEDQILEAVGAAAKPDTALQSAIAEIGTALGVEGAANAQAVVDAAKSLGKRDELVPALQAEIATLTTEVTALKEGTARARAEAFVDGEIRRGRAGVKPLRDHYIAMHMADPGRVEKELGALPVIGSTGTVQTPPPAQADGTIALNAEQIAVARMLGMSTEDYAAELKAVRANEEAA